MSMRYIKALYQSAIRRRHATGSLLALSYILLSSLALSLFAPYSLALRALSRSLRAKLVRALSVSMYTYL